MKKTIKPAIITFPGSNCERDVDLVLRNHFALEPKYVWHREDALFVDATHVIIPGGFSFGDYLRAGALAALSPIMNAVKDFALSGMPVLGICNGFQILCEAQLLPGVLMRNNHDRFVCQTLPMTWHKHGLQQKVVLPIAHRDGRYYADEKILERLREEGQIVLTYNDVDSDGSARTNGSCFAIAGIMGGPKNNIIGLMPHPERAIKSPRGDDGHKILDDFLYGGAS